MINSHLLSRLSKVGRWAAFNEYKFDYQTLFAFLQPFVETRPPELSLKSTEDFSLLRRVTMLSEN